jgi:hypothetical protein
MIMTSVKDGRLHSHPQGWSLTATSMTRRLIMVDSRGLYFFLLQSQMEAGSQGRRARGARLGLDGVADPSLSQNSFLPRGFPRHAPCLRHFAPFVGCDARAAPSSTLLRPRAVHPPPPVLSLRQSREWRGARREKPMLLWTLGELLHLTRDELCDLAERLECVLADLDVDTVARSHALTSLANIRRVLLLRNLHR